MTRAYAFGFGNAWRLVILALRGQNFPATSAEIGREEAQKAQGCQQQLHTRSKCISLGAMTRPLNALGIRGTIDSPPSEN